MKCMKCGTTIPSEQVFCNTCLEDMERYPVKPGTPIQLPNRTEKVSAKTSHKKAKKPEEIIGNMRALFFWMLLLIVALATALAITVSILLSDPAEHVTWEPINEYHSFNSQML